MAATLVAAKDPKALETALSAVAASSLLVVGARPGRTFNEEGDYRVLAGS